MLKNEDGCKLDLVLDLDETLIHSVRCETNEEVHNYSKNKYYLNTLYSESTPYVVFYRPNLVEFINSVKQYYNLYIYTNSNKEYCEFIINSLNTLFGFNAFKKYVYRTDMTQFAKNIIKLQINKNNTVILDDKKEVWIDDHDNVIVIKEFMGPINSNYLSDSHLQILQIELEFFYETTKNKLNTFFENLLNLKFKYNVYKTGVAFIENNTEQNKNNDDEYTTLYIIQDSSDKEIPFFDIYSDTSLVAVEINNNFNKN